MRIHEFVDEGLGHSSHLIDLGNETAAVVDPPRFPTAHELHGGVAAWLSSGRPVATNPFVDVTDISGAIIDVRQANEYTTGHVPSALNVELGQVTTAALTDEPLTVMCGHGERAMTGASVLVRRGHHDVVVLDGGPDTWSTETGRPLAVGS